MIQDRTTKIKNKYKGEVAKNYETSRKDTTHWRREQHIVERLLDTSAIDDGSRILDIPVGTGRFFPLYKDRGYHVLGLDASPDMLGEAESKAKALGYSEVELRIGDITDISLEDNCVDVALCIRLMNWFDFPTFQRAMSELVRVSSQYIIIGVRMSSGWKQQIGFYSWLKHVLKSWKHDLRIFAGRMRRSLRRQLSDSSSPEPDAPEPPLVDHSETAIRRTFQEQGLTIVQEKHALLFTSDANLSGLGTVQELPYQIFLLRI